MRDTGGRSVRPLDLGRSRAALLLFIARDCPVSNDYAREVGRISKDYGRRAVKTYVVYVEKVLNRADARRHWLDYGYPCPGLMDPERKLVRFAGATKTPEAALIDRAGKVVYRGRIDDTYIDYGKRRDVARTRDLRNAIEAFLNRKPVNPNRTPVVGCYIPD